MFAPLTRVSVVLSAAFACAVACTKTDDRASPTAVAAPVGIEGATCYSAPCNAGLACTPTSRTCAKPDHPEIVAAAAVERERERAFREQSGVEAPVQAERAPAAPPPTTVTAGAIRIVRVSNDKKGAWAMAACRPSERLVSGGCKYEEKHVVVLPSYPSGESTTDTIGAHWTCGWRNDSTSNLRMEAFALCERL